MVSAVVRSSMPEWRSDSRPTNRTSPMIDDTGARNGGSTPGGREPETRLSFSVTVWRARAMSWPQSNSTQTTATPTAVADRTRRTPAAPFSDDSIGNVTSDSISSGSMPGASVSTVTVGAVRSGKHVERHAPGRPHAPHEEGSRRGEHQRAMRQRPANESVNHQRPLMHMAVRRHRRGQRRQPHQIRAFRDDVLARFHAR